MFTRLLTGAALLGILGCATQQSSPLATYTPDTDLKMTSAPRDGNYALYTATGAAPVVIYPLHRGDRLGFLRDPNGRIEAVAGTNMQPLSKMVISATWNEQ